MTEAIWEERYREGRTGWDRGEVSPALNYWLEQGMLAPCSILVPGCGHGYEVVALARRGFAVTGMDIAPTPIERLTNALKQERLVATLMQCDVLQMQGVRPFDAIYEQTCLCAIDPIHWEQYERVLHSYLKPGGKLFLLLMQTGMAGGPPFHCAETDVRALFPAERWLWPAEADQQVPHPSGRHELAFILTRI